jgi:glycosyltransferase involved in cell wall biosynthesis
LTNPAAKSGKGEGPLVSVVIPSFNSEKTILRSLNSVLSQTYSNYEIIVADDASKDDTRRCVESLEDSRITFLESEEKVNMGPAAARNRGLAKSRGEYVAFLDSDDEWLPEKLAKQVDILVSNADCSILVSNAYDISPEGEILGTQFDPPSPSHGREGWRVLLKQSFIGTPSVMTRTALVRELGGFDPTLIVAEDQDLWIRLALKGELCVIDEVLGKIHVVPTGHMSRHAHREAEVMLPMIERHVERLAARLSRREIADILGHRYQVVGRRLFLSGNYLDGIKLLTKASARHGKWLSNFFFLCHANAAGARLKKTIKAVLRGGQASPRRQGH